MKKKISIEGITCQHCVNYVNETLVEIEGVKSVKVDLEGKNAVVELDHDVDDETFIVALDEAGYEVTNIE